MLRSHTASEVAENNIAFTYAGRKNCSARGKRLKRRRSKEKTEGKLKETKKKM